MIDDIRLAQLGKYTPEGKLTPGYGDHYIFMVGRDDVHSILLELLKAETMELDLNMFGYDDPELDAAIQALIVKKSVFVQISLDKSQASGVHEKIILDADRAKDPTDFSNSFVILESGTHQISHTKGGVLVAQGIYFHGSTNWSASGEGIGISLHADIKDPAGFKAQNNTLEISTNMTNLLRFKTQLKAEHNIGLAQNRIQAK